MTLKLKFLKSHFLIICVIILVIFLGILCFFRYKDNKDNKEAFNSRTDDPNAALAEANKVAADSASNASKGRMPNNEKTRELSKNIQSAVNSQLSGAGYEQIDPVEMDKVVDEINAVIGSERDSVEAKQLRDQAQAKDDNATALTTITDTTAPIFLSNTYFQGTKFGDGFCQTAGTNPETLNNKCNTLTSESCNQTDCCIFINGNKCVAGDANGPTITTDVNGNDIDYAYYSYKNQCYGSCGKGLSNAANPCTEFAETDPNVSTACLRRLWAQTKCPNTKYITPDVVKKLADYSKKAIKAIFKLADTEPNYATCYGANPNYWPPPCTGTTDTSYDLTGRCLSKLFTNTGCTNTAYITKDFINDHKLDPKSAMINQFKLLQESQDDESLYKCYGPDELSWPDPCLDNNGSPLSDSAKLWTKEVPLRCAKNLWKQHIGCPKADLVDYLDSLPQQKNPQWTLGSYRTWLKEVKRMNINKTFKGLCFGPNPNVWPGVTPVNPDPCSGLKWNTEMASLSNDCKKKIADSLPGDSNGSTYFSTLKNKIMTGGTAAGSTAGSIYNEALMNIDLINFQNDFKPYLVCIGPDNKVYYRDIVNPTPQAWVQAPNSGSVLTIVQLQDQTFLGVGTDFQLKTKEMIHSKWVAKRTPSVGFIGAIQLEDGSFLAIGTDNQVYSSFTLTTWRLIPNSGSIISLVQIYNSGFLAIGTDHNIYYRASPFETSVWQFVLAWPGGIPMFNSITQFGDFIGAVFGGSVLYVVPFSKIFYPSEWVKGRLPNVSYVIYATSAIMA